MFIPQRTSLVAAAAALGLVAGIGLHDAAARDPAAPKTPGSGGPVARLKENIVCCPRDTVLLDGWASISAGSEVIKWGWDLTGDRRIDTTTATGEVSLVAPDTPCSRTIYLAVWDRTGAVSKPDSMILHVMNSPPRTSLAADTTVSAGTRVAFAPHIWCNCSRPVRFEWDFNNDGRADYKSEETGNAAHVFPKPGTFPITFRLIDDLGREAGAIQKVHVLAGPTGGRSAAR